MTFAPRISNTSPGALPPGFIIEGSAPTRAPRELVKGVLAFDGVTFIGGQSGAGKTFVAVDLAVALSSPDGTFFGRPVRERIGVAILAAEGVGTLANRIAVAKLHRQITEPLPVVWTSEVGNLSDTRMVRTTAGQLNAGANHLWDKFSVRLGAVIIDTVSAAFGMKDENDNAEAARIVTHLRELGAATGALMLPVHHYGKAADSGLRGGSAFRANADGVISVNASRNDTTGEVTGRSLAVAKYRNGEEGPIGGFDLRFTRLGFDDDDDEYGNCYVEPLLDQQAKAPQRKLSPKAKLAREALAHVILDCGEPLPPAWRMPAHIRAASLDAWRQELISRSIIDPNSSNPRVYFQRLKDSLASCYAIGIRDGLAWLSDGGFGGVTA